MIDPGEPSLNRLHALGSRAAGVAVMLGLGAAWFLLSPSIPHEHRVTLRLGDAATVTGVELAWLPFGKGEPLQGASWRFAGGRAPRAIQTNVSLPDGRYTLDLLVEREAARQALHPTLVLGDAADVTIPLP